MNWTISRFYMKVVIRNCFVRKRWFQIENEYINQHNSVSFHFKARYFVYLNARCFVYLHPSDIVLILLELGWLSGFSVISLMMLLLRKRVFI